MTIREYTQICQEFSHDTKDWAELPMYGFFTTTSNLGWEATCDNSVGGMDVSWAFHEPDEKIAAEAPQRMLDIVANLLEIAIDEQWDAEQFHLILDWIS